MSDHGQDNQNKASQARYGFSKVTSLGASRKIKMLRRLVQRLLPPPSQAPVILEVGPGRGEFAGLVLEQGYDYVGIEPSDELRRDLQSKGLTIVEKGLPEIALSDREVDVVYSFDVLEHLDNHNVAMTFMSEAYRVLKPDGHMIVIAPNAETLGPLFYVYEYQHSFVTTVYRVQSMLRDSGFVMVSSGRFLTSFGLSEGVLARSLDRFIAQTALLLARSPTLLALGRLVFGEGLVFKVHKNIYDHFFVVARKMPE